MIPINPYTDWDLETFVDYDSGATGCDVDPSTSPLNAHTPRLHPVYVALEAGTEAEVDAFIAGAGDDATHHQYMLDALGFNILSRLKIALRLGKPATAARLSRLYIYRRQEVAYQDAGLPFEVLSVGPAAPSRLQPADPTTEQDDSAAASLGVAAFEANLSAPAASLPIVTGVIDDIMGIANERFRDGNASSRIHRFWAQNVPKARALEDRIFSGPVLTKDDIDARLAAHMDTSGQVDEAAFYDALYPDDGSARPRRPTGFRATHGTHVLDLAAGEALEDAVATRPIMAVQLPPLATEETWGARLEHAILSGVQAMLNWADSWPGGAVPCVINLSYGVQAGPKNGQAFLEAEIARLIKARHDEGLITRLVLPAGNGYRDKSRARLTVAQDAPKSVTWKVLPQDQSSNFIEVWSDMPVDISLRSPTGAVVLSTASGTLDWRAGTDLIGRLYPAAKSGAHNVTIALAGTTNLNCPSKVAQAGAYEIEVSSSAAQLIDVAIEVHRDETPNTYGEIGYQSYLDYALAYGYDAQTGYLNAPLPGSAVTREGTLSAFATVEASDVDDYIYVVGGIFAGAAPLRPSLVTASAGGGVTRNPTGVAVSDDSKALPGQIAAGTFSGSVFAQGGTSVSAPQVARALVDAGGALPLPVPPTGSDARLGAGAWATGPVHRTRPARRLQT